MTRPAFLKPRGTSGQQWSAPGITVIDYGDWRDDDMVLLAGRRYQVTGQQGDDLLLVDRPYYSEGVET